MLDSVNPYIAIFRKACDMLRDHGKVFDLRIRIIQARKHRRLSIRDGIEHFGFWDVIIQKMEGTMQRID